MRTFVLLGLFALTSCQAQPPATAPEVEAKPATTASPDVSAPPVVEPPPQPTPLPKPPPAGPSAESADYAIHEWGVIRVNDSKLELQSSDFAPPAVMLKPPVNSQPIDRAAPAKPLLFFHPGPSYDFDTAIEVTVSQVGGNLRERWPTPGNGVQPAVAPSFTWSRMRVLAEGCDAQKAPKANDGPCWGLDASLGCEAAGLPQYLGTVPHCLDLDGFRAPVLLYNSVIETEAFFALETRDGELLLRNLRAIEYGWGQVAHEGSLYQFESLAPNAEVVVSSLEKALRTDTELRRDLDWELRQLGLTQDEANSFMKAWERPTLSQPFEWQVIALLSGQQADAISTISAKPAPTKLVRALLMVWGSAP
jgi:hypothetical protein